jgi:hypothetical protein
MFLHVALCLASVFFSKEKIETHLSSYSETEKVAIAKDLEVVKSVCFSDVRLPIYGRRPVYLATAGGPGSRKTTILERFLHHHLEYAHGAYIDPDPRTLRYMVHTYYSQSLSPLVISESDDYSDVLKEGYYKWRGGSNYIALTLLEEAFQKSYDVVHGTTSTGSHIDQFFPAVKEAGYKIVLLLCSCEDELRKEAIEYRNKEIRFFQSSPEDAVQKGILFPERMPLYFQYADTLYLFWSDSLFEKERLAAVVEHGKLEIRNAEALQAFIAKYESDRELLMKEGKELPAFDTFIQ